MKDAAPDRAPPCRISTMPLISCMDICMIWLMKAQKKTVLYLNLELKDTNVYERAWHLLDAMNRDDIRGNITMYTSLVKQPYAFMILRIWFARYR